MAPFKDFEGAVAAALQLLHQQMSFDMWFVTRVADDNFVALASVGQGFDISVGDFTRWQNTFCFHMARTSGPCIFPDLTYAGRFDEVRACCPFDIRAYAGAPLRRHDGSLFGTLCAISRQTIGFVGDTDREFLATIAGMLSTILDRELTTQEHMRELERAREEASRDALTGLLNRRGWDRLVAEEEARCRRYGHPAGVILIDLDRLKEINDREGHDTGDQLLRRAARVIDRTCRSPDIVARLGGDEFGVLAIEATPDRLETLMGRIRKEFSEAGIDASAGGASRRPDQTIRETMQSADRAMYLEKKARRQTET